MRFWQAIAYVHRESWAFLFACPLLALIPVAAELAQHAAEMHIGMYRSIEAAQAAESHPLRLGFGLIKTLALSLAGYWVVRFVAGGRDAQAARRFEPRAVRLFAVVFALQALLNILALFVFTGGPVAIGFMVFGFVFGILAARFAVAAPLGTWISPLASIRQMARHLPWSLAFAIVSMLPLMTVHYALGIGAIPAPYWAGWPMLVADALVVGWLAALLAASSWVIAARAGPLIGDVRAAPDPAGT